MKVTVAGKSKEEQIIAGIDPWETAEIEIDPASLTVDQRKVVASERLKTLNATPGDLIAAIDARLAEDAEREQDRNRMIAENVAGAKAWAETAQPVRRPRVDCGVEFGEYEQPAFSPPNWLSGGSEIEEIRTAVRARLQPEIDQLNAAEQARVAPLIEAARAEIERKNAEEKSKSEAEARAKYAKRLETGILEIELSRGDRREWGEPWIAKVTSSKGRRPNYEFSDGSYDAATETLSIPCKPGEVIAYGQKNYRKEKRTIHHVRKMEDDGRLTAA